jgi:hypothetical protein
MESYNNALYDDVIKVLKEFQEKYPRPGIPDLLKLIKGPYHADEGNQLNNYWQDFDYPGVYLIFSKDHELLYVGMSTVSIGSRLNAFFGSLIQPKNPQWLQDKDKTAGYVLILAIDKNHRFEAPAIEDYIGCRLNNLVT